MLYEKKKTRNFLQEREALAIFGTRGPKARGEESMPNPAGYGNQRTYQPLGCLPGGGCKDDRCSGCQTGRSGKGEETFRYNGKKKKKREKEDILKTAY